jgi:hypothetical protein
MEHHTERHDTTRHDHDTTNRAINKELVAALRCRPVEGTYAVSVAGVTGKALAPFMVSVPQVKATGPVVDDPLAKKRASPVAPVSVRHCCCSVLRMAHIWLSKAGNW